MAGDAKLRPDFRDARRLRLGAMAGALMVAEAFAVAVIATIVRKYMA